jgi:triacylglycerol lipase
VTGRGDLVFFRIAAFLLINMTALGQDTVVLLHGWWSSPLLMKRIEPALNRDGFHVVNLAYPSVSMPLDRIGTEYLPEKLRERVPAGPGKIHFVTHSMGGLVLRRFLMTPERPTNLGRVVMLGPPNHGSEAADFWSRFRWCRLLAGPNLVALGTGATCAATNLSPADFVLCVVAGDRPVWPFWSPLPAPHDGKVSVASTRLTGMCAHHVIRRSHTLLPLSRRAAEITRNFLRCGPCTGTSRTSKAQEPAGCW